MLLAALNALAVAYLIFYDRLEQPSRDLISRVRQSPWHLSVIALVLVLLAAIVVKAALHRGQPFHGGMPSAHSAVAFAGWTAITYISAGMQYGILISFLAVIMAFLVAQTRVESGIHSVSEVFFGGGAGNNRDHDPVPAVGLSTNCQDGGR